MAEKTSLLWRPEFLDEDLFEDLFDDSVDTRTAFLELIPDLRRAGFTCQINLDEYADLSYVIAFLPGKAPSPHVLQHLDPTSSTVVLYPTSEGMLCLRGLLYCTSILRIRLRYIRRRLATRPGRKETWEAKHRFEGMQGKRAREDSMEMTYRLDDGARMHVKYPRAGNPLALDATNLFCHRLDPDA